MNNKETLSYIGGTVYVPKLDQELPLHSLSCRRDKDGSLQWEADVYDTSSSCEYHFSLDGIEPGQTHESIQEWERAKDKRAVKNGTAELRRSGAYVGGRTSRNRR